MIIILIMKLKESKEVHYYLRIARKLEKLYKMKVSVVPIVIGANGRIPNG